jgi:hypothetical protein
VNGQLLAWNAGVIAFSWRFSSTSVGETQTAYQIVIERNSDGAAVADTGQVTSINQSGNVTIASTTFKATELRWKIRVWDGDNVVGPYSQPALFSAMDASTVAITAPTPAQVFASPVPNITWTFTPGTTGATQTKFRVFIDTQTTFIPVYDSGYITGAATSWAIPQGFLINTGLYRVTVTVHDSFDLENSQTVLFSVSFTAPAQPSFTLDGSGYPTNSRVRVTWTNATIDATFNFYRVYRRPTGGSTATWVKIFETNVNQANYTFDDYTAGANTSWDYAVVQSADRFGADVESTRTGTPIIPADFYYWLIDPANNGTVYRITGATADNFTTEFEEEEILVVGRGRKTDYGEKWGIKGTLSGKIMSDPAAVFTPRVLRQILESFKDKKQPWYLRNPFGDIILVTLGDIQITRIAGVSIIEFVEVSIPYSQVTA